LANRGQFPTLDQFDKYEELKPVFVPLKLERRLGLLEDQPNLEKLMQMLCMQKKDSNLPLCAMHNVPLKQDRISIDPNAPALGRITCYVCPISNSVVVEGQKSYARRSF
jgi:hypothetical protein